jgi:hypothetical protein
VLEPCGREMRQIVFLYRVIFGTELVQHHLHVRRIPDDHRVCDEIDAPRLVGLGFLLLTANHAFVGHEKKISECVQKFAFIELGIDPPAVVFTLQVAQDKERLDQAAIFLQSAGEDVLQGIGL